MDFYPHGIRALPQRLKAHLRLDTVARHFIPNRLPVRSMRGKGSADSLEEIGDEVGIILKPSGVLWQCSLVLGIDIV